MSGLEETSQSAIDIKEDTEFDAEDQLADDYFVDPTRYLFYRYYLVIMSHEYLGLASLIAALTVNPYSKCSFHDHSNVLKQF